jgi:hypothetical protein
VVSGVSFWMLSRLVSDIGSATEGRKPRGASLILHAFRLLVLGGATFGMLKVYGAAPGPLTVGLLVPVAAIFLEVLYEVIYARA